MTLERSHTRYEKSGGTAALTLARAENRNAITGPQMLSEIIGGIDDAESDPEVGVLVITGDGPAFSAGLGSFPEKAVPGYCRVPSAALQAISHHTDAHHVAVEDYLARMQAT